ncbi:glycosyltransferase [Mesobacillus jeotgali]|uniref:glycosyltransferase n=1 Tax=Mesobacillus jeotgali TaxID=129985 RepID=UPI0009A7F902|nr:glycosyltransferase [Mesobacillus jeotgali]
MKKLKILFHTRDDSRYIVPASQYFIKELTKITELTVSHDAGHIEDIIAKSGIKPDFIYFNDYLENLSPVVTGLKTLKIPFAVGLHDLHYRFPERKNTILDENIKYIFTYYRDKFLSWYPEFANHMIWLPHHVNTEIFKDYHLPKDIDMLLMGSTRAEVYPLRVSMVNRLQHTPGFVHHTHPGYRKVGEKEQGVYVGESYAKELNRAKICLTCDSIYKYPLMKYYEITAANSLLLAPVSDELMDLGFIPGVNFISINETNFEEKASYYLDHENERRMISLNGMKLSHQKHSTMKRVFDFVHEIKKIIQRESES